MRKKLFKYIISYCLLLFTTSLFSQNQATVMGLEDIEAIIDQDTAKVNLYILLSHKYLNEQKIDSSILVANKGLFLAKKLDYTYGIGELYASLGDIKVVQNELFQALDYYLLSVDYINEGHGKGKLANVFLVIGNIYITQANYPKALEYYHKGQAIADSLNIVSMMVHFYNNTGELYYSLGQLDDALNNYNNALEIYSDITDSLGQATVLSSLSDVYLKMNNIQQAKAHLEQAFIIYEKSLHNEGLLNAYNSMAAIERKEGNYTKAISFYQKGLVHLEKIGVEYKGPKSIYEVRLYTGLGYCFMKIKNYRQAEKNLLRAYQIARKNGQLGNLENISLFLSQLYDSTGDDSRALDYYREYDTYSDSLSHEENIKKLTQLEMQFEFDKMIKQKKVEQAQLELIQKRKELIYIMVSSSIFLAMLILFLLFRLQKNKVKRIKLERQNLLVDLDYKNKELTTNVMYLLKKNEFIISISDKLKKSRYDFKPENRKIIDDLIRDLEHSSNENIWKDFEMRFQEVHAEFYQKLNKKFPDLSPNELKLCAFLRLNMSTKEISTITYQSPKSISMARFRLRKKMEIGSYDNLISYLGNL